MNQPTGVPSRPLKPMPMWLSILLFAIPSGVITFALFIGVGALMGAGWSPMAIFVVTLAGPLALMLLAALVAYRLEGHSWSWAAFRDRMRLGRMGGSAWVWTTALSAVMFPFGGSGRFVAAGALALLAIWLEKRGGGAGLLAGAVLAFVALTWIFPSALALPSRMVFYTTPQPFVDLMGFIRPDSFMGISLAGAWWMIPAYVLLMLLNIFGEELWWRGYILPRQELTHGRWAWVVHGLLWAAFHFFLTPNLGAMLARVPGYWALSWVCQREGNTWPGIVAHFAGNSAILFLIVGGVMG